MCISILCQKQSKTANVLVLLSAYFTIHKFTVIKHSDKLYILPPYYIVSLLVLYAI